MYTKWNMGVSRLNSCLWTHLTPHGVPHSFNFYKTSLLATPSCFYGSFSIIYVRFSSLYPGLKKSVLAIGTRQLTTFAYPEQVLVSSFNEWDLVGRQLAWSLAQQVCENEKLHVLAHQENCRVLENFTALFSSPVYHLYRYIILLGCLNCFTTARIQCSDLHFFSNTAFFPLFLSKVHRWKQDLSYQILPWCTI